MRLGPLLGIVYRLGAEGLLRVDLGLYRLGGETAYAAAERRETGKLNDLCNSLDSSSEVLIVTKTQT